jgi:zinc protease
MRVIIKKSVFFILLVTLISCSSKPKHSESTVSEFKLRDYQEETLANGLQILFVPDDSLPRVSLNMVIKVGASQDPEGLEGLSQMTGWLLEDGTVHRTALQLADEFAYLGTELNTAVTHETSSVNASSLTADRKKLLQLFSEVILRPAYSPRELVRKREQALSTLKKLVDNPSSYADHLLDEAIYGNHPYSRLTIGSEASLKRISKSDLIKQYFRYYRPNNAMLAVVGSFDEAYRAEVRKTFGAWRPRDFEKVEPRTLSEAPANSIKLVTKPGLKQAQIRFGHLGIQRTDADFLQMRIANLVLGGSFSSRLNQRIRDDLGLTYSISSRLEARKEFGSIEINTFSRNEMTARVINEARNEFKKFANDGISSKELAAAKALMIGQFPAAIETSDRLAFNLMVLKYYGVSDNYLKDFIKNVNAITLKEVNKAIKLHYHPKDLKVVVFADEAQVAKELKALGEVRIEKVAD